MKKLKRIVSWTIWGLLATYVTLVILIQLPPVQGWIGRAVAGAIGSKLGTEVHVGRVDLGFLNRLIVDDVVVKDHCQKDMLTARRLSVKIELLPLLSGRVSISSAQLFGARLTLYRDSANAESNYQFVVDALTKKENDPSSRLDVHIGSIIARRLQLSYDQHDAPLTPGRLNLQHLKVADVSAHVLLRTLTDDTLNVVVKRLALREQSGLDVQHMQLKLEAGRSMALLSNFDLKLPGSSLSIDSVQTTYVFDSLLSTIAYHIPEIKGKIAMADMVPLLPETVPVGHEFTIDVAKLTGTASSFDCHKLSIATTDHALALQASGQADSKNHSFRAGIRQLNVSSSLLDELSETVPELPDVVKNIGNVSLSADVATDDFGDIRTQGHALTGCGSLAWHGTVAGDGSRWAAHVDTDSLDIGRVTANSELGLIAVSLGLSGKGQQLSVVGEASRLDLHGYTYRNINLDGSYSPDGVGGRLRVDDANLRADVEMLVEGNHLATDGKRWKVEGTVARLVPQMLRLSDRWDDAAFKAVVDADITVDGGETLFDGLQGTIDLDDFYMTQNDTTHYHLDNLHVRLGHDEERHYVRMTSDFGEVTFAGHSNGTFSLPPFGQIGHARDGADNDFELSARLSESRWMQQLLGISLDLQGPLQMEAQVNDGEQLMLVKADIPSFRYANADYRDATILIDRQGDSTTCNVSMKRLTAKGRPVYLSASMLAHEHQATTSLSLFNEAGDGGTVNLITSLYRNDEGKDEAHMRIMPSRFVLRDNLWDLEPCDVLYSDKRLMIDHFTLHHDDEHLIIDGIASTHAEDTLMLDMQGMDVAYVQETAGFHDVHFGGHATGQAYVCQAFSQPEAWASITVGDFLFQDAPMGALEAFASWNGSEGQIDIEAVIDNGADAQTFVDGFISPRRKELDLGIQAHGTSVDFVHSFTNSFLGFVKAQAYGDVRVFGPLKQIDITGDVAVNGSAAVKPLGTTYTFANDTVYLSPGAIGFRQFVVADRDGHQAVLNGQVTHTFLKDIHFDLRADADRLLAYDFPQTSAGSAIGGTVWANGTATMKGRPGEVVIDCDVTPAPGSVFVYNASSPEAVSRQQFITWEESTPSPSQRKGSLKDINKDTNKSPLPRGGVGGGLSDLHLNLRINATPDATLRLLMNQNSGDYITLNGTGTLRASYYNKGPFQMYGTYNIERGTYSMTIQNLLKKSFQFQPGSTMVFSGDPFAAALNWKAVHTVNGVSLSDLGLGSSFTTNTIRVNCLMNIVGTAGEPRVEFDLEMPTVNNEEEQMIRSIMATEQEINQQVVYLLGIGRFYTQGVNNANAEGYGQTELAMQSLLSGTVSSQINQLLSQVIKNDDWNFGANISTGNEGWHNAEYEGLVSGRMLNNRLLLNGQFGYRDNATQASPSFIGDFDIQYLLTPGGSLALKAYNQTNDRYFTHSSLNTQGIGVIMKKDFNGLGDLFSHRRKTKR